MFKLPYQDEISVAEDIETIRSLCKKFAQHFEFEYFFYADIYPSPKTYPDIILVDGFPKGWMSHYSTKNYSSIDPVIHHCVSQTVPIIWEDIQEKVKKNTVEYDFVMEACQFGLCSGISFPIHSPLTCAGIFSLGSPAKGLEIEERIESVKTYGQLFGIYIHSALQKYREANQDVGQTKKISLTNREIQCLMWAAEGRTTKEIAKNLDIVESTVIFHLQNAAKKLGANNRVQAVAQAIKTGIIQPVLRER